MKNLSHYPQLLEIVKILYGTPLIKTTRNKGIYPVFGSGGCIGYHNQRTVYSPTIIIGRKGSVGNVIFSEDGGWPIDTTFYVEPKTSINMRYLYWALKSLNLSNLAISTSLPGLNRDTLYSQRIYLPPEKKQLQIASTLDEIEDLIKKQQQALDLTKQMIPSLFYEMFVNLNDTSSHWPINKLEDVIELINGHAFKTSEWTDIGLPIIRIQNLNNSSKAHNFYSGILPDKYLVHPGDVLLSWSGTPGTSFGCFRWTNPKGWLNQHIFKVLFKQEIESEYFIQFINYNLNVLIKNAVGGVGLQHITKSTLNSLLMSLPPLSLQKEFTQKSQDIRMLQLQQEESLKSLETLFESFSQKTFVSANVTSP